MRSLLRGERTGSTVQVVILAILLVTTCVALTLTVATRYDATTARASALADRKALHKVTAALKQQCAQQIAEQVRLRDLERTDAELQRGLIAADTSNSVITAKIRDARRRVYDRKLAKDVEFLHGPFPTPAVCEVYDEVLPISFAFPNP